MSDSEAVKAPSTLLMQFAKWPEAGRVKTRLIPELGEQGALAAHLQLTTSVFTQLSATNLTMQFWWDRPVAETPAAARELVAALSQRAVVQKTQAGADLGERMEDALGRALTRYDRAIIVGSDCPSVDADYVREAIAAMDHADVVLGPSDDGGYVLIGARRVVPAMLTGIQWGTPEVLAQTCQRLAAAGLTVTQLQPRWDVDEPADWHRFMAWASADQSTGG
ncbi:MAG: TIGR04282 family arsenosugar biosynthesis glycosyltransferase [Marinobacter sp.]|uniref:TIGR04282 family arsenosugar biosynthesis glycosyltransferase n=1 Tax=Marinobacter sp. TaxID=50741 RepID=UPI00299DF652|nr:TIGR04282 family arsenosugar biosynthesis glycosyltransferase [Marinobacter sp.]MDX1633600.1 TIGR04282 family arsenosugar biosynthesis glycosyltransferase [Marinobacter sp.]